MTDLKSENKKLREKLGALAQDNLAILEKNIKLKDQVQAMKAAIEKALILLEASHGKVWLETKKQCEEALK